MEIIRAGNDVDFIVQRYGFFIIWCQGDCLFLLCSLIYILKPFIGWCILSVNVVESL